LANRHFIWIQFSGATSKKLHEEGGRLAKSCKKARRRPKPAPFSLLQPFTAVGWGAFKALGSAALTFTTFAFVGLGVTALAFAAFAFVGLGVTALAFAAFAFTVPSGLGELHVAAI
jgi:hypothetical protein